MLGPKIDARLNTLEHKLVDLTHRLERVEKVSQNDTKATESVQKTGLAPETVSQNDTNPVVKRRGRPPKAKNG